MSKILKQVPEVEVSAAAARSFFAESGNFCASALDAEVNPPRRSRRLCSSWKTNMIRSASMQSTF